MIFRSANCRTHFTCYLGNEPVVYLRAFLAFYVNWCIAWSFKGTVTDLFPWSPEISPDDHPQYTFTRYLWTPVNLPGFFTPTGIKNCCTECSYPFSQNITACWSQLENCNRDLPVLTTIFRVGFLVARYSHLNSCFWPFDPKFCEMVGTYEWYFVILWMQVEWWDSMRWWGHSTPTICKKNLFELFAAVMQKLQAWTLTPGCEHLRHWLHQDPPLWNFHINFFYIWRIHIEKISTIWVFDFGTGVTCE